MWVHQKFIRFKLTNWIPLKCSNLNNGEWEGKSKDLPLIVGQIGRNRRPPDKTYRLETEIYQYFLSAAWEVSSSNICHQPNPSKAGRVTSCPVCWDPIQHKSLYLQNHLKGPFTKYMNMFQKSRRLTYGQKTKKKVSDQNVPSVA